MRLQEIVNYQNNLLNLASLEDHPNSLNGLQVENSGDIHKVAAAVDACEAILQMAVEADADLLLVHHGLCWHGLQPVTGALYRKLKLAIENDLAVYSAHLPLDAHSRIGNNALLCNALDLPESRKPFLGIGIQVETALDRGVLRLRLEQAVGGSVLLAAGGPILTRKIGIVTGAAGDAVYKAAAEGVDTFITGEGPHWSFTAAEELRMNLFYAGHYATEVFGVKALARAVELHFGLPWIFLDHPTGL